MDTPIKSLPMKYFANLKHNGLSVLHCNICRLHKNCNKLIELLPDINFVFDVILVSETFLYSDQHNFFPLLNYSFVADSRSSRAGIIAIYLHSGMAII